MGHREPGLVADEIAEHEEVEVERPGAPADLGRSIAAHAALDAEEHVEELARLEVGLERDGAVQVRGLLDRPPGLGLPECRDADDVDSRLRGELLDRTENRPLTVSEVRSDADVGTHAATLPAGRARNAPLTAILT